MKYSIGEVAKLFDMTKGGVRHYEQIGLLTPVRDEGNGYRYYSRDNITMLKHMRGFQALGFSLEEARALAESDSDDHVLARLHQQQQALERQIALASRTADLLQKQCAVLDEARARQGEWFLAVRPALCRIPVWQEQRAGAAVGEREHMLRIERSWTANMPVVTLCDYYYEEDGLIQYEKGSCALVEEAKRCALIFDDPLVERYASCECLTGFVKCRTGGEVLGHVQQGLARAAALGYAVGPARLGRLLLVTQQAGERWMLGQITLPVM